MKWKIVKHHILYHHANNIANNIYITSTNQTQLTLNFQLPYNPGSGAVPSNYALSVNLEVINSSIPLTTSGGSFFSSIQKTF